MHRLFVSCSFLAGLLIADPVSASSQLAKEPFSLSVVHRPAERADEMIIRTGRSVFAQRGGADRQQKEEKQDEADRRKAALEDAQFAPTCNPLKDRVVSLLASAGTEPRSFNQALSTLREIEKQLPNACPQKIQIFGSSIVKIVPCYNKAIFIELADGTRLVWSEQTRTFKYGPPKAKGEKIMGLADTPYYCIQSISPIVVWAAVHIGAMARRDYDVGDRESLNADRARRRAREIADLDKNITEYDRKIQLDPKDTASIANRGIAYLKRGDYARSIADFERLIKLEPANAMWWNNRCYARAVENREIQMALSDCNKSLQLKPDLVYALGSRGFTYLRLGELDKAIADYNAALKLDPESADSLYGRGLAQQRKGNRAGGDADIAAAIKIDAHIAEEFARYGFK